MYRAYRAADFDSSASALVCQHEDVFNISSKQSGVNADWEVVKIN